MDAHLMRDRHGVYQWACGKCGTVYKGRHRLEYVEHCCRPPEPYLDHPFYEHYQDIKRACRRCSPPA